MNPRLPKVAALLYGSGLCALIYQTAWLRELRLIFGASTAASAAVLAIFMGGLGVGGVLLGRRADRSPRPLSFYGNLELLISVSAAFTPFLVLLARQLYVLLGGSVSLGLGFGTVLRLVLAALVLAAPTLLMGGTLPAAARAVETDEDVGRRALAVLYGVNTLGAVTGAVVSTFFLLEIYGTRNTLWLACLINALVGLAARVVARDAAASHDTPAVAPQAPLPVVPTPAAAPLPAGPHPVSGRPHVPFVLAAAAVVGFAFFLMELVWYRMLGPLLGGSTFTFGLILAVALAGIGLGGAAYAAWGKGRPATLAGFALACAAEAAFLAVGYALGDNLAFAALLVRPLSTLGFAGLVLGWASIATVVILPAAFVSGAQFPLLIALLGSGRDDVGRQVGTAYAWNTLGSIVGSLAGGFGAMPLLGALGSWKLVVAVLGALALVALALSARAERTFSRLVVPLAALVAAAFMMSARGPTGAWRHSPIGAGRASLDRNTLNGLKNWANAQRRAVFWEADGLESSVAMTNSDGISFHVNGKSDGNTLYDAPTQVMAGLVGALLHPAPRRALVVGLGTGSSAGWLAAVPGMERVDVVELEPAILDVARACASVNQNVMDNPRVKVTLGDAREVLLASRERYDIIFSEPSNPYRAGISSLFTREFYRAVKPRLNDGGLFLQWVQAYEIDAGTLRSVIATLASEFPHVEIWMTEAPDLLLVAGLSPRTYDAAALRAKVAQEPYRSALVHSWRVSDLEGVLGHFTASEELVKALARDEESLVNTDDLSYVEFALARSVGKSGSPLTGELWALAHTANTTRPSIRGEVDWSRVDPQSVELFLMGQTSPPAKPLARAEDRQRVELMAEAFSGNLRGAYERWRARPFEPQGPFEVALVAELLAEQGLAEAQPHIDALRAFEPVEADAVQARLRERQGKREEAVAALESAFTRYRTDPWPMLRLMERALDLAGRLAMTDRAVALRLYPSLRQPFASYANEVRRQAIVMGIAEKADFNGLCAEALAPLEKDPPWKKDVLEYRLRCYVARNDPRAERARRDLEQFLDEEPQPLAVGLERP